MHTEGVEFVPVVVIGAGPTGVTVATLLAQYGIDVLILDRWEGVYPQPRAVHMDDEVMRVLARLGIADRFAEISRPALGLRLLDKRHRVLAEFSRTTDVGVHGFPQANMYDQPELERLLRANLQDHPRAVLRGNSEVTEVAEGHQGLVRVTYTDRGGGAERVVDATYALGCDGANSIVRSRIGSTMQDMRFEQRWLVVDIATAAALDQWEGVHQVCDPVRAATYMRIGETRYRWEFRLLDGETAEDFADLPALAPLIGAWTAGTDHHDLELIRVAEYTFRARIADKWRRGPIFLLGDAAHLTPPFIGQGLCAGLRDAMNLAWKTAGVLHGALPDAVLNSYEAERKPHARYMIATALAMGRAMTAGGRLGAALRHLIVPRLRLVPGLHDKLVDGVTPALRRSALVSRNGGLRRGLGGQLAPNTLQANGIRLDDIQGRRFAVITTKSPRTDQRASIDGRGACLIIAERNTELFVWLSRARTNVAVVRPDGTVMAAGSDLDKLLPSLPQFGSANTKPASARLLSE
ncbi:bifunctional 3-(3-hydroxy-phenyl)propionate/3-hydroxycinnamic acid hydroxylase MhpA [Mycobacterium sherrisii]|uniref:bifunctional 3-(3-hydroxy-phenyl)propionate/3-hydroxycinnamic acid hydroxylase MhpA n=1 Tax=Mycobacterium sherrisii TaxID=243061 RepID=UPI000A15ABCA|nr:bifunctional 3-(3-hydroxy-phenyl)propionate/3-hydroxycinnamic acid hydroxylase [Mycobacterium sherrisii]MCV7030797.1 bifunctional 3-(3-hydroxy-phenyl)propionate/3-hydroxycinnamic acid hydroxylase [Mycobacterium sherrisii]ORW77125.1 3-(3-hydroxyphenyl)propionate hydroxylase [Mycobacterium sherrisii]